MLRIVYFVSEQTLSNIQAIHNLTKELDIHNFDQTLVHKKVGSSDNYVDVSTEEKELIINSQAYAYYLQMRNIENKNNPAIESVLDIEKIIGRNLPANYVSQTARLDNDRSKIKKKLSKFKETSKEIAKNILNYFFDSGI